MYRLSYIIKKFGLVEQKFNSKPLVPGVKGVLVNSRTARHLLITTAFHVKFNIPNDEFFP